VEAAEIEKLINDMSSSEQGKLSDDDRSLISKCAEKSTDKPLKPTSEVTVHFKESQHKVQDEAGNSTLPSTEEEQKL